MRKLGWPHMSGKNKVTCLEVKQPAHAWEKSGRPHACKPHAHEKLAGHLPARKLDGYMPSRNR